MMNYVPAILVYLVGFLCLYLWVRPLLSRLTPTTLHYVRAGNVEGEVPEPNEFALTQHPDIGQHFLKHFHNRDKDAFLGKAVGNSMSHCDTPILHDACFVGDKKIKPDQLKESDPIVLQIHESGYGYKLRCFKEMADGKIISTCFRNGQEDQSKHDVNQYLCKVSFVSSSPGTSSKNILA